MGNIMNRGAAQSLRFFVGILMGALNCYNFIYACELTIIPRVKFCAVVMLTFQLYSDALLFLSFQNKIIRRRRLPWFWNNAFHLLTTKPQMDIPATAQIMDKISCDEISHLNLANTYKNFTERKIFTTFPYSAM